MLKQFRNKKTQKKILIGLAVVIVPAFLLWGSGSLLRNKQEDRSAGWIFGRKITALEFQDSINAVKNQALIQFGDKFSEIEKSVDFETQGWERLILLAEAKKRKINVSDQEVVTLLQNYPFFQNKGAFDKYIYSQMLQYVFRTPARMFEEQVRQNLMIAKLYQEVTGNLELKESEIKEEYKKANEEISVYYIAGVPGDFEKEVIATEQELKDYYLKSSLKFKVPLSFNVEYVELISDGKNDSAVKERLKKLYSRLMKKEPFEKVAKTNGLILKETGQFPETGPIPGIGWPTKILNLIAEEKVGRYLNPIHIDKSYYVLRIKERKEPYIPDFETIKNKVNDAFIKEKSQTLAKEKMEKCLKSLKEFAAINPKSVDFDKTASILGLKKGITGLFKYDSYIEGIGASDRFWETANILKDNEFSGIIEMPAGFYILKVKSKIPADEKKFQNEKSEFTQRLLAQKKQESFYKFLSELKRQTQQNELVFGKSRD